MDEAEFFGAFARLWCHPAHQLIWLVSASHWMRDKGKREKCLSLLVSEAATVKVPVTAHWIRLMHVSAVSPCQGHMVIVLLAYLNSLLQLDFD